ncbi:adhesion G-protein coupled receptor G4 [Trichonephila clavipes]|nr:adhesion G-protein coupled receptor G4 [Trichonephila clavipes]
MMSQTTRLQFRRSIRALDATGYKNAEDLTGELWMLTEDPKHLNVERLQEATKQIEGVIGYAIHDKKKCTPPTSTTSKQLFLLLITGMRLNNLVCGSLSLQCSRQEQTILARFRSGHLRTSSFRDGNEVFRLVLGVLLARHLQNTFLTAGGFQNEIFLKTP